MTPPVLYEDGGDLSPRSPTPNEPWTQDLVWSSASASARHVLWPTAADRTARKKEEGGERVGCRGGLVFVLVSPSDKHSKPGHFSLQNHCNHVLRRPRPLSAHVAAEKFVTFASRRPVRGGGLRNIRWSRK